MRDMLSIIWFEWKLFLFEPKFCTICSLDFMSHSCRHSKRDIFIWTKKQEMTVSISIGLAMRISDILLLMEKGQPGLEIHEMAESASKDLFTELQEQFKCRA